MKRLKELRLEAKLTQTELAKEINQTKSNISKYENGILEPNNETLQRLADFFDVTVDYLLGRSNLREPLVTIAAHTDDPEGIPPEAQEEIFEFIEYVRHKYGIGKKDKGK